MENKIRLVWDFRGADALKTAEHQLIHLVEFMKKEDISYLDITKLIKKFFLTYNKTTVKNKMK